MALRKPPVWILRQRVYIDPRSGAVSAGGAIGVGQELEGDGC